MKYSFFLGFMILLWHVCIAQKVDCKIWWQRYNDSVYDEWTKKVKIIEKDPNLSEREKNILTGSKAENDFCNRLFPCCKNCCIHTSYFNNRINYIDPPNPYSRIFILKPVEVPVINLATLPLMGQDFGINNFSYLNAL